ncbi:unnamed protein product [Haemonchus placei]|uniref:Rab5-bind domain-containing protein n=1 Tax=Haemonchus placei TaxID=6290 RepID=A0A0N4XB15_HAEPC|nr:unnamed protein product [Haemonchus placei]
MEEGTSNFEPDGTALEDAEEQNGGSGTRSAEISPSPALTCEMCQNYEINLTSIQENERKTREKLRAAKSLADRYETELTTERKYRMDVEKKMTELAAQFSDELKCVASANQKIEERVNEFIEKHKSSMEKYSEQLQDVNHVCSEEQLEEERNAKLALERDLLAQVNHLQTQLGIAASKLSTADAVVLSNETHERQIRDLQNTVAELEAQVKQVQSERAAVELTAQNYKARCTSLQSELDTSEAVQKDFVQLSQSLQIQLEKIRQSEQEVRWQWEDDVENCSGCGASVLKTKPRPRLLLLPLLFIH